MSWKECVVCRLIKSVGCWGWYAWWDHDGCQPHTCWYSIKCAVGTFGIPPFFLEAALYFAWSLCWLLPLTPPVMKRTSIVSDFSPLFVHLNWNTLVLVPLWLVVCLELGAKYTSRNVYRNSLFWGIRDIPQIFIQHTSALPLFCLWRCAATSEWKGKKKVNRKKCCI